MFSVLLFVDWWKESERAREGKKIKWVFFGCCYWWDCRLCCCCSCSCDVFFPFIEAYKQHVPRRNPVSKYFPVLLFILQQILPQTCRTTARVQRLTDSNHKQEIPSHYATVFHMGSMFGAKSKREREWVRNSRKWEYFIYCLLLRRIQQNICLFPLFDWLCVRSVFPKGLSGAAPFCFVSVIVMNVTNRRNVKEFLSDNRYYKDTVV